MGKKARLSIAALGENIDYKTEIKEKSPIADLLSHTYNVKMVLNNPELKLIPGMTCDVNISNDENKTQIIIPNSSVMLANDNSRFVWIVHNNSVKKQTVIIEQFSSEGVIVKEGLKDGDLVIVKGNQKLREGSKIRML